jgi:uncharacterized protein
MIFDTYVALPSAEGSAAPDPSVARLFSAQSSAYTTGGTPEDILEEYDAHGVEFGLLAKVPRDITPPFVPAMQLDDEAVHHTCQAIAETVAAHPGRFLGTVGLDPKLGYEAARHVRVAVEQYGMRVERTLREGKELPLRPEALTGYLGDNAARVFGTPEGRELTSGASREE